MHWPTRYLISETNRSKRSFWPGNPLHWSLSKNPEFQPIRLLEYEANLSKNNKGDHFCLRSANPLKEQYCIACSFVQSYFISFLGWQLFTSVVWPVWLMLNPPLVCDIWQKEIGGKAISMTIWLLMSSEPFRTALSKLFRQSLPSWQRHDFATMLVYYTHSFDFI